MIGTRTKIQTGPLLNAVATAAAQANLLGRKLEKDVVAVF
jgi:hypothetical protein